MGYIKEPEGVDFVINGKPLTDKQKNETQKHEHEPPKRNCQIRGIRQKMVADYYNTQQLQVLRGFLVATTLFGM